MASASLRCLVWLSLCDMLVGFQTGLRAPQQPPSAAMARRATQPNMGSAAAVAAKAKVVEEVKETLKDTSMMFCVRSEKISVNDMNMMRQKFDDSVTVRCVKNTLVKRAVEDYPKFQGGDSLLEYSNYWFFVPEDQMRGTVDTWLEFVEESKKEELDIVGGVFEGELLDKAGVVAITKLPTKQELMQQTAVLMKALPAKLARTLNQAGAQRLAKVTKQAAGQKLVQAVKAMEGKKE